jgi:formate dehydrogenase subunit delta
MEVDNMVHMANQVADHLQKFWEPRMRKQITQYVAEGGAGLHDLAIEAVKRLH